MNQQLKSQVLGMSLAMVTAMGCLAYERLVKSYSYFVVGFLVSISYLPFWISSLMFSEQKETLNIWRDKWIIIAFLASGATGPLWYAITRKQSVMVGATYEIKYILIMAIFYIFLGQKPFTLNTGIGICFAISSVYFISKP